MAIFELQSKLVKARFLQLHVQSRAKSNIFFPLHLFLTRRMSTTHQERTAAELREDCFHRVILRQVDNVNESVRLFKLEIPNDVHIKVRFLQSVYHSYISANT